MIAREVMRQLSKLSNEQLDDELLVYHRDIDRFFEISSFETNKGAEEDDNLEEDQPYLVT